MVFSIGIRRIHRRAGRGPGARPLHRRPGVPTRLHARARAAGLLPPGRPRRGRDRHLQPGGDPGPGPARPERRGPGRRRPRRPGRDRRVGGGRAGGPGQERHHHQGRRRAPRRPGPAPGAARPAPSSPAPATCGPPASGSSPSPSSASSPGRRKTRPLQDGDTIRGQPRLSRPSCWPKRRPARPAGLHPGRAAASSKPVRGAAAGLERLAGQIRPRPTPPGAARPAGGGEAWAGCWTGRRACRHESGRCGPAWRALGTRRWRRRPSGTAPAWSWAGGRLDGLANRSRNVEAALAALEARIERGRLPRPGAGGHGPPGGGPGRPASDRLTHGGGLLHRPPDVPALRSLPGSMVNWTSPPDPPPSGGPSP
jgi:hypothetical protein